MADQPSASEATSLADTERERERQGEILVGEIEQKEIRLDRGRAAEGPPTFEVPLLVAPKYNAKQS